MKTKAIYIDEVSKKTFDSKTAALKSERASKAIKKMFSWIVDAEKATQLPSEKGDSCKFSNGGWCVQRDAAFVQNLKLCLLRAVKEHEPWIAEQFKKDGGLKLEYITGLSGLSRYLDDGRSFLCYWDGLLTCICPKCYREYGQPYYALNCHCDGTSGGSGKKVETRVIKEKK
jgi:hypothetical protein